MKIAVLLSGGVDSSVALYRLKELGLGDMTAFYLKIWLEDELSYLGSCPWEEDLSFAREVCDMASIPLKVVPLQREYYERVVEYVLRDLRDGNTPSPDIFCNQRIKFGAFLDAVAAECDRVATGHYAMTTEAGGACHLLRSRDRVKDQTYFLSHLRQDQVARAIFPIGHLQKKEVRGLAREWKLPNRDRKDSQGICFLGKLRYPEFVKHYLGEKPGPIIEQETGRVLGEHRGFWFHTIGQRQGLRLGGGPWYVVGKDTQRNIIFVTSGLNLERHCRRSFEIVDLHWIAGPPRKERLATKVRHGPQIRPCTITPVGGPTPLEAARLRVELDSGDPGVAPGQFAVLYDGEECLGGGVITAGSFSRDFEGALARSG